MRSQISKEDDHIKVRPVGKINYFVSIDKDMTVRSFPGKYQNT